MTTVFLEASDEVLVRRFSETRRPHPLVAAAVRERGRSGAEAADVIDGVRRERELLAPLRAIADVVIDTSALRVHDLRRRVLDGLRPEHGSTGRMASRLLTFGFKFGLPADADLAFDVRFLDNPYFVPELRELTGEDARVRDYVLSRPDAIEFLEHAERMLRFLLPRYQAEGKSYLTVAIGCTGGKHRSVSIAIALAERLGLGDELRVVHRDARAGGQLQRCEQVGDARDRAEVQHCRSPERTKDQHQTSTARRRPRRCRCVRADRNTSCDLLRATRTQRRKRFGGTDE
jgi:UPF0042 nucleotide-binding protein